MAVVVVFLSFVMCLFLTALVFTFDIILCAGLYWWRCEYRPALFAVEKVLPTDRHV